MAGVAKAPRLMVMMDAAGETDGEVYDLVNEVEESKVQDLFQLRDKIDRFAAVAAVQRHIRERLFPA